MAIEVRVPTLGESVSEATVATWFKKPGDAVAVDEMLCELETDKVTVEVPSPAAGVLAEIVAAEGTTVGVNALLAQITEAGAAAPAKKTDTNGADSAKSAAPQSKEVKMTDVMVPALGESVAEATVSTWFMYNRVDRCTRTPKQNSCRRRLINPRPSTALLYAEGSSTSRNPFLIATTCESM